MDGLCPQLTRSGIQIENPRRVAKGASPGPYCPLTSAHQEKEVVQTRRRSYFGDREGKMDVSRQDRTDLR